MVTVVGAGLLGGAVLDRLGSDGERATGIDWSAPLDARRHLRDLGEQCASTEGWRAAWCAGAGVVGATDDTMREEHEHVVAFLHGLTAGGAPGGRLFVASSAGGVHGGGSHRTITEADEPAPRSAYGRGKLDVEQAARAWSHASGAAVLVGRISNLYGPGQAIDKGTGFLSEACQRSLRKEAITIRVPLETARDFVHADDVAARVVDWLDGDGPGATKLLVSGASVTLARAAAVVRAVGRHRTLLVHVADPHAWQQPRYLRFRSSVLTDLDHRHPARPLEVGVLELFESLRAQLARC
jgi:UDP-glucose 4-epimerase